MCVSNIKDILSHLYLYWCGTSTGTEWLAKHICLYVHGYWSKYVRIIYLHTDIFCDTRLWVREPNKLLEYYTINYCWVNSLSDIWGGGYLINYSCPCGQTGGNIYVSSSSWIMTIYSADISRSQNPPHWTYSQLSRSQLLSQLSNWLQNKLILTMLSHKDGKQLYLCSWVKIKIFFSSLHSPLVCFCH